MILQVTPARSGPIGELLADIGIPFAGTVGTALSFLIAFLAIFLIGRALLMPLVERLLQARNLDRHARRPLRKLTWFVILFAAFGLAFGFAGLGSILTSLATIAAAATLAIGFAMQDVLKNFVAGVFIYTDKPFRIGDWIEWDDHSGIVEDISLRVSRVRTFDNERITVPNGDLANNAVTNPVAYETLRQKFVFGIGYDDDISQATDIIVEEAEAHEEILDDPGVSVRLVELGDSAVGLQSRWWIADPDRGDFVRVRSEYVTAVKEAFDEAGIDMPYVHRQLTGSVEVVESVAADE
jgi:small-conductance mechanosensitive channel